MKCQILLSGKSKKLSLTFNLRVKCLEHKDTDNASMCVMTNLFGTPLQQLAQQELRQAGHYTPVASNKM